MQGRLCGTISDSSFRTFNQPNNDGGARLIRYLVEDRLGVKPRIRLF